MSDETRDKFGKSLSNASSSTAYNPTTPKELMTAYQRWELASFDPKPDTGPTPHEAEASALIASAKREAAELKRTQQQAYDEQYAAGYAAGIKQAQAETVRMQALIQSLHVALNQVDEQLAQSLLDLSLEIAQKMIFETLQVKPEIILKIVSQAISSLPHFNQNAHLILHPDDAELVRKLMGEQLTQAEWKIFTDAQIEPGGCRIETDNSNIDSTNQTRWKRIVDSMGQDKSWLT